MEIERTGVTGVAGTLSVAISIGVSQDRDLVVRRSWPCNCDFQVHPGREIVLSSARMAVPHIRATEGFLGTVCGGCGRLSVAKSIIFSEITAEITEKSHNLIEKDHFCNATYRGWAGKCLTVRDMVDSRVIGLVNLLVL